MDNKCMDFFPFYTVSHFFVSTTPKDMSLTWFLDIVPLTSKMMVYLSGFTYPENKNEWLAKKQSDYALSLRF